MSKLTLHLITAIGYFLIGAFIAFQQNLDGGRLTEDYFGLALAMYVAFGMGAWSLFISARSIIVGQNA